MTLAIQGLGPVALEVVVSDPAKRDWTAAVAEDEELLAPLPGAAAKL